MQPLSKEVPVWGRALPEFSAGRALDANGQRPTSRRNLANPSGTGRTPGGRALGDPENLIVAAIAVYRRFDKYNPKAYVQHSVRKDAQTLRGEAARNVPSRFEPNR